VGGGLFFDVGPWVVPLKGDETFIHIVVPFKLSGEIYGVIGQLSSFPQRQTVFDFLVSGGGLASLDLLDYGNDAPNCRRTHNGRRV
jgi:hypothetical protein